MVALTQKRSWAQYGWFCHGWSHLLLLLLLLYYCYWWKTPPESPDFNPIENLWHELKEYICREVKLKTKAELVDGIKEFWKTVTVEKCTRYIRHLRKVIPRAIKLNGARCYRVLGTHYYLYRTHLK